MLDRALTQAENIMIDCGLQAAYLLIDCLDNDPEKAYRLWIESEFSEYLDEEYGEFWRTINTVLVGAMNNEKGAD